MKLYAVARVLYLEGSLELSFVNADSWRSALQTAFNLDKEAMDSLPADHNAARDEANNQDWDFIAVEAPSEM